MSSTNSWAYNSIPVAANGGTKVFNRVITSRSDSGRFYEKRGEDSFLLVPVGTMMPYAGTSAPGGYLLCNGAEVYRSAFPDLFSVVGIRYGAGDGSTTFVLPALTGPSTTNSGGNSIVVGYGVDKDMTDGGIPDLPSEFAPDGNGTSGASASYWDDWGNDIFDNWGYFYLYDPGSSSYEFLILNVINQADGVMATQTVSAFERSFTIVHGYCARGIYRFEITCTSDNNSFRFGAYGDMGSDESTINTNPTGSITVGGTVYPITYNRNVEEGDDIEKFFSYFIPFNPNELVLKPYSDFSDGEYLYMHSNAVTNGLTVYFAKKNDVLAFIQADLRVLSGKIRGGAITTLDADGNPIVGVETSYIIKC